MKVFLTCTFAAGLLLAPAVLQANPGDSGFYLGAATGTTEYAAGGPLDTQFTFDTGQEFSGDDSVTSLFSGYRFTSWFAIELAYSDHGSATKEFYLKPNVNFIVPPKNVQTIEASDMALRARLGYEFANGFGLHVLAGYSRADFGSEISGGLVPADTDTLIRFESGSQSGTLYGAGASFAFTESIALEFNWQQREYDDIELEQTGLGLRYSF